MTKQVEIRRAFPKDASSVDKLLNEWFDWKPASGRLASIQTAIKKREVLVATHRARIVGFVHCVMHGDIIDGGPNCFISAFYISTEHRGKGIGARLLEAAVGEAIKGGAVGVETSTIHSAAKRFYERYHFKQTVGDIAEVFLELDIPEYLRARKISC